MPNRQSQTRGNKNLFHGKQQRTIFSQHGCPVRPSPSAGHPLWGPTVMCQVVFVFHHPLNPGGVGPPCEGCYGQHEKIWDCWPPPSSSAEDCDSTSALEPDRHTDTPTHRHSVSRGVWTDVSRGNSWPLTLGSYRGVCTSTCVHVRCVFIMFSVCIWAKKHSWDRWGCFLFPLRLLVSPQFCSQSEVRCLSAPHLSQVNSPLTASCGIGSTLTSLHHYSSSLPLSFPRSRLTSPGAQCWDFLTFNTSVCLRSSCTPEKVHKLADMPRRR